MQVSVYTTKFAENYRVFLDGEEVKDWIDADDVAGTVTRGVADTSGSVRLMRQERVTGTVVIEAPAVATKAE